MADVIEIESSDEELGSISKVTITKVQPNTPMRPQRNLLRNLEETKRRASESPHRPTKRPHLARTSKSMITPVLDKFLERLNVAARSSPRQISSNGNIPVFDVVDSDDESKENTAETSNDGMPMIVEILDLNTASAAKSSTVDVDGDDETKNTGKRWVSEKPIEKQEKALYKLQKGIKMLEEREVNFDEDDGSVYLLTERAMDRKKVFSEDLIPRCYQQEMEEFAVKQNTIIYLPTGTGKTFIASQLLRRCKKDVIQPLALGGKRCFFLVNTVALVTQQRSMIENGTVPLTVNHYSSEKRVDLWKKDRWLQELNDCQVAVMTAQIFLDIINHGHINLSQVRLIIFDECHHAVNDHPMRQIMRQFEHCIEAELPRVLGLTATLLNSNVKINMVESEIRKLETTFHAKIATVSSLSEVMEYSTNPLEFVLQYPKLKECDPNVRVIAILDNMLAWTNNSDLKLEIKNNIVLKYNQMTLKYNLMKPQKVNTKIKNNIDNIINSADAVGVLGVSYTVLSKMIQFELLKRTVASSTRNEGFFQAIITSLTRCRKILADYMSDKEGYDQFVAYASPKVMLLMSVLQEYNPATVTSKISLKYNTKGLPLQALIFTKERFVAKTLFMLLKHAKECNKNFEFLKPDFIVGRPCNPFKSTREDNMEKKKNSKVLTKFRMGLVNVLVTTYLMEEGIDIPECTLVVKFDEIMEYRSYVQSKGRARKKGSSFVMMTEESGKLNQKLKSYHEIEKLIQSMLVGKTMDRKAPTREEIEDHLYNPEINPYIVGKGLQDLFLRAAKRKNVKN